MSEEVVELVEEAEVAPYSEYPPPSGEGAWRATAGMLELFENARIYSIFLVAFSPVAKPGQVPPTATFHVHLLLEVRRRWCCRNCFAVCSRR
jgi:hypothetical protein